MPDFFEVKLDLKFDEADAEFGQKLDQTVRAATVLIQSKAQDNLYAGIYAQPEDPDRPRTGALVNSVYAEAGGVSDKQEKIAAAKALNPLAKEAESEFEVGEHEGKVGVGVEYGVFMEAYLPYLEPAAQEVQAEMEKLFEDA